MAKERRRCRWCGDHADYQAYHDTEWGFPVDDDRQLFEKLCLEGFQSGLSWLTILRKRKNFRAAFAETALLPRTFRHASTELPRIRFRGVDGYVC